MNSAVPPSPPPEAAAAGRSGAPSVRWRAADVSAPVWITVGSCALLAAWQPLGLVITLALAWITWEFVRLGRTAPPARRKFAVRTGVTVLILVLVVFKYTPWLLSLVSVPADWQGRWFVPLGLSFTVFRLVGVLLDGTALKQPITAGRVFFLTLFAPTFVAGPITTNTSLTPLACAEGIRTRFRQGSERIILGLFRKAVLADQLQSLLVGPWLAGGANRLSPQQALVLPVLLGLEIYWDFAGYSDIAIGAGALLGYRVPENFNRPYVSRSVIEFWRRWHITLSEWIRTRLMMKMAGRRATTARMYAATVISMGLCGLWHGAGLNFLVWGLWHGVGLAVVHLFGEMKRRSGRLAQWPARPAAALSTIATFVFVTAGWIVFFLPLSEAMVWLQRVASLRPGLEVPQAATLWTLAALGFGWYWSSKPAATWGRLPGVLRGVLTAAMCGAAVYFLVFGSSGPQEFIYAQF